MKYNSMMAQLPDFVPDQNQRDESWMKAASGLQDFYKKIIVLDDDPTGSQTVYDLPVYTRLDEESLAMALEDISPVVYILTNSRSLSPEATETLHSTLIKNLCSLWKADEPFLLISRSDSTLRGHYPLETEVLSKGIERMKQVDGEILIPFFLEGGRYTVNNTHYVKEGEELIPAGDTEFAKDSSFSFKSSDLCDYIEEKTKGSTSKRDVLVFSLDEIRRGNIDGMTEKLMGCHDYVRIIVNAASYEDLKLFISAYAKAVFQGKYFMFRSAASFVKILAGLKNKEYLEAEEILMTEMREKPGLIVAGSYVGKTSRQLNALLQTEYTRDVRFNIKSALFSQELIQEKERCIRDVEALMSKGKTVCLFTENAGSREFLTAEEGEENLTDLQLSSRISHALVDIVKSIKSSPDFVLTKGGITSHDIACNALKIQKADVLGQIAPGIPVWRCGDESRWPGIPLIIFPGNVGVDTTLRDIVLKLSPL